MNFRTLAGNAMTAFAAQGVVMIANLVMSLLVPKVLGVTTFGYWQLFIFYANYAGVFFLGLNDGVYLLEGGKTREELDKKSINSQFVAGVVLQLFFGACIIILTLSFVHESARMFVLGAFVVYMLIANASSYLGYVFQAVNETKLYSYMTILERAVFLVPLVMFVTMRVSSFEPYVISYLLARGASLVFCCCHARDILAAGILAPSRAMRLALVSIKIGLGLMFANLASMLILGTARWLIDFAWGVDVFGRASFALSIVSFFLAFVTQAAMVLFPALRQGTDSERREFYRGSRDVMEIAFPFVYLLYFPAAALLSLWLPQYAVSMQYFAILIPLCVFDSKMNICGTTYFKVLRGERVLMRVNMVTALGSVLCSLIGIYVCDSLDIVLLGVVFCVICRSLWSERYLDSQLSVPHTRLALQEIVLTIAFVGLVLLSSTPIAIAGYGVLYSAYILINRDVAAGAFHMIMKVFKRSPTE